MLPFTKRPGRSEESGEVVTKESLASDEGSRDNASDRPRPFAKSISDEELTTLMPSKNVPVISRPSPASVPPPPLSSRPASVPPPPMSRSAPPGPVSRSVPPPRGKFMREEDEGRTAVRGAPKIVKKKTGNLMGMPTSVPTTVSPAAVIKATLDSARPSGKRNDLMSPPPKELLEELADMHPGEENPRTVQMASPRSVPPQGLAQPSTANMGPTAFAPVGVPSAPPSRSVPPAPNSRSVPPAPISHSAPPSSMGGHPYAPYGVPVPPGSVSVPGVVMAANASPSMPAHFMVPQAPYSDARMDPPGTVVPANAKSGGRSAASWAMALLVLGLGVGIGGIALMRGNADGLLDTTAAFIDPSRAAAPRAAGAGAPVADPAPVAAPVAEAPKVAVPAVAPQGAPPVGTEAVPAVAPATPAAPAVVPVVAAAPVAQAPQAPQLGAVAATQPAAPAPKPVVAAAPPPQPVARPAAPPPQPVAAAPAPKPVTPKPVAVASSDDTPPPAKPAKGGKGGKGGASGGGSEIDEETKKALEALQKSQLESSF